MRNDLYGNPGLVGLGLEIHETHRVSDEVVHGSRGDRTRVRCMQCKKTSLGLKYACKKAVLDLSVTASTQNKAPANSPHTFTQAATASLSSNPQFSEPTGGEQTYAT